jgi:hypothetical protein
MRLKGIHTLGSRIQSLHPTMSFEILTRQLITTANIATGENLENKICQNKHLREKVKLTLKFIVLLLLIMTR